MFRPLLLLAAAFAALAQPPRRHLPAPAARIDLARNWQVESSAGGRRYPARVPSTIVSTLVDNGALPDPYFGMNLRSFAGVDYWIGDNFSNRPMPDSSPYAVPWWYRTTFQLPATPAGERLWLHFDSINYRANVWLNGRQIADSNELRGMYRTFEFDVTDAAIRGTNFLEVEVFAPTEDDFTITWVDWNPMPPDKDMGITGPVFLTTSGPVAVRNTQVVTRLSPALDRASLTVSADLVNPTADEVAGVLEATIGNVRVARAARAPAGQTTRVALTPAEYAALNIANPALWWPYGLGPQTLHRLHLEFRAGATVSDSQEVEFGIREFTSELDAQQHRLFRVNGRRILIRGGGWTQDMLLRVDDARQESEMLYARDIGLNTIRLEGKMMNEHFLRTADRLGLLVMPGWCCCSYWEQWQRWSDDDHYIAGESLRSQARRLRNHASVFVFLYSSDESPSPRAERVYLDVLRQENWPHPYLSSATDRTTPGAGLTGVKMTGPYDYVAPNYWLLDTRRGGAFGFITETSPGAAIPLRASLEQMLPKDHLWPIDEFWDYHAGGGGFPDVSVFTAALAARHGPPRDLDDYLRKSQAMIYEGERAMFEAFGRNKYTRATGVVQWMANNGWPSLIWHLWDYYLRPGGGYFGAKKANEPLHVQYSYDDRSIVVVNSLYRPFPGCSVTARVYDFDLRERFSGAVTVDVPEDGVVRALSLPAIDGLSRTYFVRLALRDSAGALASSNFYWLSTQPDVHDWNGGDTRYTPISTYADLTALEGLPTATVGATWREGKVVVRNTSSTLAFMVHLTLRKGIGGLDLAPVYWEDNYFELFPGEERAIGVSFPRTPGAPVVEVDGWNVAPTTSLP